MGNPYNYFYIKQGGLSIERCKEEKILKNMAPGDFHHLQFDRGAEFQYVSCPCIVVFT